MGFITGLGFSLNGLKLLHVDDDFVRDKGEEESQGKSGRDVAKEVGGGEDAGKGNEQDERASANEARKLVLLELLVEQWHEGNEDQRKARFGGVAARIGFEFLAGEAEGLHEGLIVFAGFPPRMEINTFIFHDGAESRAVHDFFKDRDARDEDDEGDGGDAKENNPGIRMISVTE